MTTMIITTAGKILEGALSFKRDCATFLNGILIAQAEEKFLRKKGYDKPIAALCRLVWTHSEHPGRWILILGFLTATILFFDLTAPLLLRDVVLAIAGFKTGFGYTAVSTLLLFLLAHIIKALVIGVNSMASFQFQSKFGHNLKASLAIKTLELRKAPSEPSGEIISQLNRDLQIIESFLQTTLWQIIGQTLFLVAGAVYLFLLNPWLALFAILPIPIVIATNNAIWPKYRLAWMHFSQSQDNVSARFQELLEGREQIKAFGCREQVLRRFEQSNMNLKKRTIGLARWTSVHVPLFELVGGFSTALVMGAGILLLRYAFIDTAVVLSFFVVLGYFYRPVFNSSRFVEAWQKTRGSLSRIEQRLAVTADVKSVRMPISGNGCVVENVSFVYDDGSRVLNEISSAFESGKMIGITGPNGAGKSTLIKLIAGIHLPSSGQIHAPPMSSIAYLPQEPFFFDDTAKNNLKMAVNVSNDEIEAMADSLGLGLTGVLSSDLLIGLHGKKLSGGERQRLSLLRFALQAKSATLCLLDEPTSFIDLRSEAALIKTLTAICRGKTTVIVTHRDWILDICDEVVIMDKGNVIQQSLKQRLSKGISNESSGGLLISSAT